MVQSENLKDSVLAIHRATISRADLLRVWYSVEGNALDAAKWLAHELDFEYVPLQIEQPAESPDINLPPEVPSQPEELPTGTDSIQTQRMAVESLWLPSEYLLAADFVSELEIEAPRLDGKLAWSKRPIALPPIALATWPEAKTRLSPILEPPRRSPHIDVDKLVELISQGRLLKKLPTETIYRTERSIVVVEDRSARLFPYHRDQQWLIDSLKTHLPRGYFSHLTCCDPRSMVDPNRSFEKGMRALTDQDLLSGCEFLVLSDLGILNSDWRLLGFWQEWIHERSRRDCRVSVMVPFPVDRVPSSFRDIAEFYSWQHSGVQSVLDQETRKQLVAEILSRLSPVSSFDPVLLRWIRQTVSGANDAALESFVWQDKSLDSNQYSSAKNDRVEAKQEYRKAFLDLDPKTKQWVLKLLRDSRAGLGEDPSLWFVELLSLDAKDVELIEDGQADMEDVRRAIRYLDENRGDAAVGGSITSFLKWFSSRVEADGIWSHDWGIGEVVRRWQREFQPKRALDRSTRIRDFKDRVPELPESYWLKALERQLSIWRTPSDKLFGGDSVLLRSTARVLEVHGLEDRERAFWKSGVKPRWVSDYGTDEYGAWCEFQVPRHDGKGMVTQRMRWIKPGEFLMGSTMGTNDVNKVKRIKGYWITDSPVTQQLWMAISGGVNPSQIIGETNPVECVTWYECNDWLRHLSSRIQSFDFSLPCETQWEYACLAGKRQTSSLTDYSGSLSNWAWYDENSNGRTQPVRSLLPNSWGLYDILGNVWEWCDENVSDHIAIQESIRVRRGGSWMNTAELLRSIPRDFGAVNYRNSNVGFRFQGTSVDAEPRDRVITKFAVDDTVRIDKFWKSGRRPEWVSDYGTDQYGAWCEFQVPRHDGKGMVTQRMRWIKPGTFWMGSPESERDRNDNEALHPVEIGQGYWMADSPVTQELWSAFTGGRNPSYFKGETNPVEQVSWEDCLEWVGWLCDQHKTLAAVLPTEAQWEYACRAGSPAAYCFGDELTELSKYGWFGENSSIGVCPVKSLSANRFGLYDMHGNVWEWCRDWYGDYESALQTDPVGPRTGSARVIRGGSWFNPPRSIRSACRVAQHPQRHSTSLGFRIAGSGQGAEPSERALLPVAEQGTMEASAIRVRVKDKEPSRSDSFWKSGTKPQWVSDYGRDNYGLWCEFQVPQYDEKGIVTQRMRWIKPGTFLMGSIGEQNKRAFWDETQHEVTLTQGYWFADSQVTQELWKSTARRNPSRFQRETNPVERISWIDCQEWLQKVHRRVPSLLLSLPTEAQWEYACRAGSTGDYCYGDDPEELSKYGWFKSNSSEGTHPVKQLQPNRWGLYDMHGNVWEWCSDWYIAYTKSSQSDPIGPAKGSNRVVRGGSWDIAAQDLRSACRRRDDPRYRVSYLGFRVASSAQGAEPSERAMLPVAEQGTERVRIGSGELGYEFLRSVDLDATGENSPKEEFAEIEINAHTSIRVVSDQEGYQFDRLEKPTWAVDYGSDSYGIYATFEIKPVRQRMRWIPPGRFMMGSPDGKDYGISGKYPQHEVIITHGYWMFETPCTQGLWSALMGKNPSYFSDDDRPVESVSWEEAVDFAAKLNERMSESYPTDGRSLVAGWDRLMFRLPTEAEWEYACRAGTTSDTYAGDLELESNDAAKSGILDSIAWYGGNSGHMYDLETGVEMTWLRDLRDEENMGGTRKLGKKHPNPWGLYDMLGNVWEWCQDWYGEYSVERLVDPFGPSQGTTRVVRGGGWGIPARFLRSACRAWLDPGLRYDSLGFRLLSSAFQVDQATESGK